jgi:16S rRNA (guanine527-N7)-methyltransferase
VIGAALVGALALRFGDSPLTTGIAAAETLVLMVATLTDLRARIIPNALTYPVAAAALAAAALPDQIGTIDAAIGGAIAGGAALAMFGLGILLYRRADAFGMGDVKRRRARAHRAGGGGLRRGPDRGRAPPDGPIATRDDGVRPRARRRGLRRAAARSMTLALARAAAEALGYPLDDQAVELLARYRDLVIEGTRRVNLTAIVDPDAFESLHLIDALAGLAAITDLHAPRVVDVGAGAGLPGIVLRIARPDLRLTLLDATRKRIDFARGALAELGLGDVEVLWGRAEEVGRDPGRRETWDVALAHAVAPLPVLVEMTLPLVRIGGRVVAWKKRDAQDEILAAGRAISILGGRRERTIPVDLPGLPADRMLVPVSKVKPTPAAYPRRPGVPKAKPLV